MSSLYLSHIFYLRPAHNFWCFQLDGGLEASCIWARAQVWWKWPMCWGPHGCRSDNPISQHHLRWEDLLSWAAPVWDGSVCQSLLERCWCLLPEKLKVLATQACPTLCDPMDCSPPGSSVHGILQARTLEWVAMSFSRGSSQQRDGTWVSWGANRVFTIWATKKSWVDALAIFQTKPLHTHLTACPMRSEQSGNHEEEVHQSRPGSLQWDYGQ